MIQTLYPIQMEIAGDTAIWTRPDTGDCPCSYPAPTYAAVKGLFESVLWGPDIQIYPEKVEICRPIQYHTYATNYNGPLRQKKSIAAGNPYQLFATVLTDVCYRLYASVGPAPRKSNLPASARQWNQKTTSPGHAYQAIFDRRLKRGQSFASLALGWREFAPSYFGPFRPQTMVCTDMEDILIPSMLRTLFPDGYRSQPHAVYDTNLVIHQGVLRYPPRDTAGWPEHHGHYGKQRKEALYDQ